MLARMSGRAPDSDMTAEDTQIEIGVQVRLLGGFAVLVDGRGVPESAWQRSSAGERRSARGAPTAGRCLPTTSR
jgi:hypothetical protein